MMVIGFEDSSAGQRRAIVKDLVGGIGLKGVGSSSSSLDHNVGQELSWQDGQQRQTRRVFAQNDSSDMQNSASKTAPLLRKYPPSGGYGMRALAIWSYWPEEQAADELLFPRGAEIGEVEDVNGDWFLGNSFMMGLAQDTRDPQRVRRIEFCKYYAN
ncbi:MAG: hypothetical protein Q9169_002302 [Polycauliona sp. 2 TL-2023]